MGGAESRAVQTELHNTLALDTAADCCCRRSHAPSNSVTLRIPATARDLGLPHVGNGSYLTKTLGPIRVSDRFRAPRELMARDFVGSVLTLAFTEL